MSSECMEHVESLLPSQLKLSYLIYHPFMIVISVHLVDMPEGTNTEGNDWCNLIIST